MIPIPNEKAQKFFENAKSWKSEYLRLRDVILDSGLDEDYKWMHPCYTSSGKNIVLIHGFNEYCALLFFKGALLRDPEGILIQQTENVQSGRQLRFTSVEEIDKRREAVIQFIQQAIEIEKSGRRVKLKETREYDVPEEFQKRLDEDSDLKNAFQSLTPGRQRAYLYYFSTAKQSKTRESRIEKNLDRILKGKGLNDE